MKICKHSPGIARQRLVILEFKFADDGHGFLNRQPNNDWQPYTGELRPGTYAYAGGQWHNVKSLDPSALAHI